MAQSEPDDSTLDLPAIEADLRERLADLEGREEELKRPPEEGADIGFGKRIGDGTNQAIGRITDVGVADSLDHIEARIIRETLIRHRWNKSRAARELGLSRVGLRSKLERYGLENVKPHPAARRAAGSAG